MVVARSEERGDTIESLKLTIDGYRVHYRPLASAHRAWELIPQACLAVLPGYGHAPHKQNQDAFSRLILDSLNGC